MARTIAVTGKGGTGKTAIAALIIRHLKQHAAGPILALDADPDANLATVLGIRVEKTIGDLREETLAEVKNLPAGMSKSAYIEAGLHQIVVETEKVDLLAMGRSEGPGCYCYVNNLLRDFSEKLHTAYQWVVMDNEAGMEHLSRRTASRIDSLIVVVNDSPLALDCARRIDQLVTDLKNPVGKRYLVVNMAPEERVAAVRARAADLTLEFLGHVPRDPALEEKVFNGESLFGLDESPAVRRIGEMMARMGE
ncbi:MAG: AAA family ATPase [Kiritimatiellae bacterium]|nr:AAA family ATPase [Kiritimatiellia bacterium]